MGLFDFFEKQYTDWTLEVDGKEQENVTIEAIKNHLTAIYNNYNDFIILTPSHPIPIPQIGRVCNFVQLCQDKEAGFFHFEVGTIKADYKENIIIYGKDGLSKYSVLEIINKLLEEDLIPDIENWEIAVEL